MLKTIITRIFLLCTTPGTREKSKWREQKGLPLSHTFKTTQTALAGKPTRT